MAVNGGGGVTLQFQRSPLKATTRTTFLPWNAVIVINPVVMTPYGGAGISWDEEDTSVKVPKIVHFDLIIFKALNCVYLCITPPNCLQNTEINYSTENLLRRFCPQLAR